MKQDTIPKDWVKEQLKRGERNIPHKCNCGKVSPKGTGYFCFVHKKQTPDRVSVQDSKKKATRKCAFCNRLHSRWETYKLKKKIVYHCLYCNPRTPLNKEEL